ncbi:MFS transporter [Aquicoccus sp. G2-2]|uniref:MFS transporter n=1 Tax=Aquicoccus sp. G2-2 TaxID=3092120 RepID=UPI002AE0A087|nr:MFS transporter [Aquicoccus sp. G2-2]MEA1114955.1 MFS transporter [Aquicoccus sp. G2-2]
MRADLILLTFAYLLSQFFRAFLAVLAEVLHRDIGASAEDLATASGLWFLAFAIMQLPVGWALDRVGPRLTASVLLGFGGAGGAAVFALAQGPGQVSVAMLLIGAGCAPVLMAAYYIFARGYSPAVFATLAAIILGVGSLGNLISALPTTLAAEAFGWRAVLWAMAMICAVTALGLYLIVRDPERVVTQERGSVFDLLKMPALWLIFPLMAFQYAPAAALRGLWIGPYLTQVFDSSQSTVGNASLIMGAAMVAGTFAYGPLDRIIGTRKWVIFGGNLIAMLCMMALALMPHDTIWRAVALIAAVGFFGASYPVVMAHGRSFYPPHLVGRGVTLMNLFAMGGVGVMQVLTGRLYAGASAAEKGAEYPFQVLFWVFVATVFLGLVIYLFAEDRKG